MLARPRENGTRRRQDKRRAVYHLQNRNFPLRGGLFQEEVFGCGTAAVVSHVSEVTHGDLTMVLPPVENRKIGSWLKKQIDKMRTGEIADKYGWVEPVKVAELV